MEHGIRKSRSRIEQNAIDLLVADHKKVQRLFKDFAKLKADDESAKLAIVLEACTELTIHTQLEEEIFYPAVREAVDDADLIDEANVEHASARELITQLESMEPSEKLYDAKFTVLGEYVNHHIREEQNEMFEKARKAKLNLAQLGMRMMERKEELKAEYGLTSSDDEQFSHSIAAASR